MPRPTTHQNPKKVFAHRIEVKKYAWSMKETAKKQKTGKHIFGDSHVDTSQTLGTCVYRGPAPCALAEANKDKN